MLRPQSLAARIGLRPLLPFPAARLVRKRLMTMEMGGPLDDGGIAPAADPFALFRDWLAEAEKSEPNDANAMALATADEAGQPNVRMVLLKGFDVRGFVFYS